MGVRIVRCPKLYDLYLSGADAVLGEIHSLCMSGMELQSINIGVSGAQGIQAFAPSLVRSFQCLPAEVRERLHLFQVEEERVFHPDQGERYAWRLDQCLIQPLVKAGVIRPDQWHPYHVDFNTGESGQTFEAEKYEGILNRFGGILHVTILPVRRDGSIAGLFPGHNGLKAHHHGFTRISDCPESTADWMTASKPLLSASRVCVLLFVGEQSADALAEYLEPEIDIDQCPAKVAKAAAKRVIVTDREFNMQLAVHDF